MSRRRDPSRCDVSRAAHNGTQAFAHVVDRKLVQPPFFVQIIFDVLGGIGSDIVKSDVHEVKQRIDLIEPPDLALRLADRKEQPVGRYGDIHLPRARREHEQGYLFDTDARVFLIPETRRHARQIRPYESENRTDLVPSLHFCRTSPAHTVTPVRIQRGYA